MKVEKVEVIEFDKKSALQCAVKVAKEYFGKTPDRVKCLGGGSFGIAVGVHYKSGRSAVIKFLRSEGMLEKEVHDLKLLKQHCPIRIPSVFFARKRGDGIPADCYGMETIEGKSCLFAFGMLLKGKGYRQQFADQITAALHSIHECTGEKFGDTMSPECDDWLDFYRPFALSVLKAAERLYGAGRLSRTIIDVMHSAWAKFDVIFSEKVERACLIHGDLNVGNIMIGKGYKISGIIDPLNSMYADREYDLFQFDNLTGKRFFLRETYIKKYGASRYCMQKLAFYGLWNEVYCYIRSGVLVGIIMNPLVKNMKKQLEKI